LVRTADDADWRAVAAQITDGHEAHRARLAARPADPHVERQRQALARGYADAISTLPYEADATPVFPAEGDFLAEGGFPVEGDGGLSS
ncbi:hypothetical protein ABZ369_19575, partial [Streptomyces sp. NPDC005918]